MKLQNTKARFFKQKYVKNTFADYFIRPLTKSSFFIYMSAIIVKNVKKKTDFAYVEDEVVRPRIYNL